MTTDIPTGFAFKKIDHVGLLVRNVEVAEEWYTRVLGAVPFARVGYEVDDKTIMKAPYRHLFVMLGDQRLELVEAPDWRGFNRKDDFSMSPHYAFAISPEALDWYMKHFDEIGVKYQGPIVHPPMTVASVYFTDADSNHLELAVWEGYDHSKAHTDYVHWDDLHQDEDPARPAHIKPGQFAGQ